MYTNELLRRQKDPGETSQPEHDLTGGCWRVIEFWPATDHLDLCRAYKAWEAEEERGSCCYPWKSVSLVPSATPLRDSTSCTTAFFVTLSLPLTEMLCQTHSNDASPVCSPEVLRCSFFSGDQSPHLQLCRDNSTNDPLHSNKDLQTIRLAKRVLLTHL